jgi:hypothetical protein
MVALIGDGAGGDDDRRTEQVFFTELINALRIAGLVEFTPGKARGKNILAGSATRLV